ncbi:MAG: hypothetical protein ACXWJZ_12985 [Burkholderiaceae bacterium]
MRDIDNLFSRLAKIGDSYDSYPFPTITLNEALRIKLKNVSSKAEIIRGMLSGSIRVIKNSSDEWPHLLLNKEDLEKTVQTLLMPSEANWTLSQGAHAVNIHIAIFTDLVSQGAMAIACREPEIRIDPQSVLEFQKSYFRINSRLNFIEKKINMALNLCAELNLPHFLVFGVHSFMMKKDFHLIEKHVFSRPRNSKKKLSVASH